MSDINRAYTWAIQTCNAPNTGYSQTYRNQQTVNGVTYYDCSSFINYALLAGGFSTPSYAPNNNAFTTSVEANVLLELGFTEVDPSAQNLPGDIGWVSGHTEMCYSGGIGKGVYMGAHTSNATLANQVSIGSSSGDATYERSWARLFRYGDGASGESCYSIYVVAAICGNFWQESNINPGLWEGRTVGTWTELNHGYGLGQWTNTGGDTQGRLYQLHAYLQEHGYADDSAEGQMEFLFYENTWYSTGAAADFANLTEFMQSQSTDLEMLTHAWNQGWEGIHDSSWDTRVTYAQQCFDYIQAHANDTSITTWYTVNNYLTTNQILNNAVLLYRYLSAGGGGGGTVTRRKRGMPIWMYPRIRYRF